MDSNVAGTSNIPNDASQQSSAVDHSYPVSWNRADYSQPELLIRTFQGQLDAMMVEQERMRQQLSALTSTLQAWQIQQQQTIDLLRRIQEIMDPEFAPGEALHGLRLP